MGCGCKGKTVAELEEQSPGIRYSAAESRRTVRLGLKPSYSLPLKLPRAIDGRDVIVITSKMRLPALGKTFVIVGRDAPLKPEHRAQLVARWPHVFEDG